MELTSLGRAYLAVAPQDQRKALLAHFRRTRRSQWEALGPALAAAIRDVEETGFCAAAWQPEVVALATPLLFKGARYALNVSLSTAEPLAAAVRELAPTLLALSARIQHDLNVATQAW
jgi:DNA-binding IclR family transcriptional regulator